MIQIKTILSQIIWHLKNRRSMYVFDNTYDTMVHFYMGYLVAVQDMTSISVDTLFQTYLQQKLNKQFSLHWSGYLFKFYCKEDEDKATQSFFEFWEDFIEKN